MINKSFSGYQTLSSCIPKMVIWWTVKCYKGNKTLLPTSDFQILLHTINIDIDILSFPNRLFHCVARQESCFKLGSKPGWLHVSRISYSRAMATNLGNTYPGLARLSGIHVGWQIWGWKAPDFGWATFGWVTFGWASCNIDTLVPLV